MRAVGLNFRDALNVLGAYPGAVDDVGPPGGDFAGVVAEVAPGVRGFAIGDAIVGLAPGALGTAVDAPASLVARAPPGMDAADAATLPTVYATVFAAGDALPAGLPSSATPAPALIHGGAGGVGLAALRVLTARGASSVATAGAPARRAAARAAGATVALGSRDTAFADGALVSGGRAPSFVLNALTTPGFVAASLASLSRGASFAEIGKRDIWSPARVAQDRPDVAYAIVAIDLLAPTTLGRLLRRVVAGVASGAVVPLPATRHPLAAACTALRDVASAKQVGKVVVTVPAPAAPSRARGPSPHAAWLITGGGGALGGVASRWLASQGVKTLALVGRDGRFGRDADAVALAAAHSLAPVVVASRCDAATRADAADIVAVLTQVGSAPGLAGVLHCGGVLADAPVGGVAPSALRAAAAPKAAAAAALGAPLAAHPLAHTLAFTSSAAVFGAPGQAAYAAANAALDAAIARSARAGAPARSLQWGAWDVGMAATRAVRARMKRQGLSPLTPDAGMAALEAALAAGEAAAHGVRAPPPAVAAAMLVDWTVLLGGGGAVPSFFDEVRPRQVNVAAAVTPAPVADAAAAPPAVPTSRRRRRTRTPRAAPPPRPPPASLLPTVLDVAASVLGTRPPPRRPPGRHRGPGLARRGGTAQRARRPLRPARPARHPRLRRPLRGRHDRPGGGRVECGGEVAAAGGGGGGCGGVQQ